MRRRIFEIDRVSRPTSRRLRRIMARYVLWTEVFGYIFVTLVATAVIVCWFYRVDEVAIEKDVGKSLIKPYSEPVTAAKQCVVTKVLVAKWAPVKAGDPVVEVCDDPGWVRGFTAMNDLKALVGAWDKLDKSGALPAELQQPLIDARQRLAAWQASGKPATHSVLRAPISGEFTGGKPLEGRLFVAKAEIASVIDFHDLRLQVKFAGQNVERIRVGQRANINIPANYDDGVLIRVDSRPSFFESRRLQFNDIWKKADAVKLTFQWMKDRPMGTQEDLKRGIVLYPTEVSDIEILADATTRITSPPRAGRGNSRGPVAEPLSGLENIPGEIIAGDHTATVQTNLLDDEMRRELERRLNELLAGKVVAVPEERKFSSSGHQTPPPVQTPEALRIDSVSGERIFVKLKTKLTDINKAQLDELRLQSGGTAPPKTAIEAALKAALGDKGTAADGVSGERESLAPGINQPSWWRALRSEVDSEWAARALNAVKVDKVDRFFDGTVRIQDPPAVLCDAVERLAKSTPPIYIAAKVEAVVDKRRLAMLLFRQ